jgi:hypothetical protein
VSVVLPWGSLLSGVARPSVSLLSGIRGLCRPNARLTVILALDPERDRSELDRLGLASVLRGDLEIRLKQAYREARFLIYTMRALRSEELRRWPSTWASRLAWGSPRCVWHIEAMNAGFYG